MRTIAALAAALVAGAAIASDNDAPARYHHHGMQVIMHHGGKDLTAPNGDTPLDHLSTFDCTSAAGCDVILNALAPSPNAFGSAICPQIDGHDGIPKCQIVVEGRLVAREFAKVEQGTHTVQTILRTLEDSVTVNGWRPTTRSTTGRRTGQIRTSAPAN